MKDEQLLEEELMGKLDRMYLHAVDLENGQGPVEHHHNPNEYGQASDQEVSPHSKIIAFPGQRIPLPSGEPSETSEASEEEPRWIRKRSYRTALFLASSPVIFLAFVLVILPSNVIIGPRGSEKGEPYQLTFPIHLKASPPVQREVNVLQTIEEREPRADTVPQQTVESKSPPNQIVESKSPPNQIVESKSPPQQTVESKSPPNQIVESKSPPNQIVGLQPPVTKTKHYAVQFGLFRNWENASRLIDGLRKENLEPYWIEKQSRSWGTIYLIFSGSFKAKNEAVKFMRGKDIRKNYPGSFVRRIAFKVEG
jgi:cell division septation protein DedD